MLVLGFGVSLSGQIGKRSQVRVLELKSRTATMDQVDIALALNPPGGRSPIDLFSKAVHEDAETFGVSFDVESLQAAQLYSNLVTEPVVIGVGERWSAGPIEVSVATEALEHDHKGVIKRTRHTVATVRNASDHPIAYRIELRPHHGADCERYGTRVSNAIALAPDEAASIVMCVGRRSVELVAAETLAISELGYWYLTKVPPEAWGYDETTRAAHVAMRKAALCSHVDSAKIAAWLADGIVHWVDVADFFSRHHCERYAFFSEYRYSGAPVALPVSPRELE